MRTAEQTSAAKLRGGFYTPDALVDLCLRRVAELVPRGTLRVLECCHAVVVECDVCTKVVEHTALGPLRSITRSRSRPITPTCASLRSRRSTRRRAALRQFA